jgi:hypothetical protein
VIVDGSYITQDNIVAMAQAGVDQIGPQLNPEQQRQRNTQQALQRAGIAPEFSPERFALRRTVQRYNVRRASGLHASAMEPPVASAEPIQPTARTACIGHNTVLGVKRAA